MDSMAGLAIAEVQRLQFQHESLGSDILERHKCNESPRLTPFNANRCNPLYHPDGHTIEQSVT